MKNSNSQLLFVEDEIDHCIQCCRYLTSQSWSSGESNAVYPPGGEQRRQLRRQTTQLSPSSEPSFLNTSLGEKDLGEAFRIFGQREREIKVFSWAKSIYKDGEVSANCRQAMRQRKWRLTKMLQTEGPDTSSKLILMKCMYLMYLTEN